MSPAAARQRDLDEIEVHRIGRVSDADRIDAAVVDSRAVALDVRHVRRRQGRLTRVTLGQSRLLRALRRGQAEQLEATREHGNALADVTAALIVRDARQAAAAKAVVQTQATKAGAKVAAPITIFVVVVELLRLVFGG